MNKTPETFPNLEIPTIIPDTGVKHPYTDADMNYLKKKNNGKDTHQKLRNKYLYETNMHKIYNIIVGQTDEQIQDKTVFDDILQVIKTGQYLIG